MPSEIQHLRAAAENRGLATSLLGSAVPGWGAVLAFYSALHQIDAFLARSEIHPGSHSERRRAISMVSGLRSIDADYRTLETRSREVRYMLRPIRTLEVESLLNNELSTIEQVIKNLLEAPV